MIMDKTDIVKKFFDHVMQLGRRIKFYLLENFELQKKDKEGRNYVLKRISGVNSEDLNMEERFFSMLQILEDCREINRTNPLLQTLGVSFPDWSFQYDSVLHLKEGENLAVVWSDFIQGRKAIHRINVYKFMVWLFPSSISSQLLPFDYDYYVKSTNGRSIYDFFSAYRETTKVYQAIQKVIEVRESACNALKKRPECLAILTDRESIKESITEVLVSPKTLSIDRSIGSSYSVFTPFSEVPFFKDCVNDTVFKFLTLLIVEELLEEIPCYRDLFFLKKEENDHYLKKVSHGKLFHDFFNSSFSHLTGSLFFKECLNLFKALSIGNKISSAEVLIYLLAKAKDTKEPIVFLSKGFEHFKSKKILNVQN